MKKLYYIFIAHIVLLILASTNFSIILFIREGTSLSWNYGTYSHRNGFGFEFVSEYTLLQVLAYVIAYATGLVLFSTVYRKNMKSLGALGLALCIVGLISFIIEGSHWILNHHLSWIASFPIALVAFWILLGIDLFKDHKSNQETEHWGAVDAATRRD